jgi:hypothetical protein
MSTHEPDKAPAALTCFVVGPIGNCLAAIGTPEREAYEESLRVMEEVIAPACAHHGLEPVRADKLARAGEITEQIFRRLREDDVVIADLTGANANVMYELGLRHTRDKLTVQIGEYGRLPFDINTIRTIQFTRSPMGLINAREELIQVLAGGLTGDYDQVAATRIWTELGRTPEDTPTEADGEPTEDDDDADERGFLEIMADAEEQQEQIVPALTVVGECVTALGELSEASTKEVAHSDAAGKGMRGRLQVMLRYASRVDAIADRLEEAVDRYASVLAAVSAGTLALIGRMEEDPNELETGREFGMVTRRFAVITRSSMASLAGMVDSMNNNARLSKALREPTRRVTVACNRFAQDTSIVDEWDRRLQSLGISLPPEDWKPDPQADVFGGSPADPEASDSPEESE